MATIQATVQIRQVTDVKEGPNHAQVVVAKNVSFDYPDNAENDFGIKGDLRNVTDQSIWPSLVQGGTLTITVSDE